MTLLKGYTDELKATAAVAPLGIAADELLDSQMTKVGKFADTPIRLYAAFPTPDSKLYFRASAVQQGDGSSRTIPAIDDKLTASSDGNIDFQTNSPVISGITLTRDGVAYTHPAADLTNKYVRIAFVRKSDGSFDSKASTPNASLPAAQVDPGTLWGAMDGLPNGFVDLECTSASPLKFKTAGSATNVIENSVSGTSRIYNLGAGGGSGGGADRTYKISTLTATTATIKGGYRGIDDKRVLSSGPGVTALTAGADVVATMATVLTNSGLSFVANKIYALAIDLTTVAAPVALDNLREVITWTEANLKLIDQPDLTLIDPRRYVIIDQIFVPTGAPNWATAQAIQWTTQVHDTLTSYFPNLQRYATQITSASVTNLLTHGLDGEPQIVQVFYYDLTNKNGKDLSSHLVNKNATQLNVSSFGLTFGGGQYLEVVAFYLPTVPNIASASRTFNSQWFEDSLTTTVPHGLSDMEDIRGYQVQEWDTVAAKRRIVDPSTIIINFDATNFYLNWTGSGVSATKKYRIVAGGSPLPWSIPDGQFDSITDRSGAGAPNFPNGATGITTGINSNPLVYELTKQAVGAVGSAGQIAKGHYFSAKSYRSGLGIVPAFWRFDGANGANVSDGSGGGRTLTNAGASINFDQLSILGEASAAARLPDLAASYFSSTDALFDQGTANNWEILMWVSLDDWNDTCYLLSQVNTVSGSISWAVQLVAGLGIRVGTQTANSAYWQPIIDFVDGSYHAIGVRHVSGSLYLTVDNEIVATLGDGASGLAAVGANRRLVLGGLTQAGGTVSQTFPGRLSDAIFINDPSNAFEDQDWYKLHTYRLDHNTGVAVANQKWSANFYDGLVDQGDGPHSWIVDKYDANSIFVDFAADAATDEVELFMEDRSLSPTTVGSVVPYDVIHNSNPTFPIAHGQSGVPQLEAQGELSSGVWEPVTLTGHVSADSTNFVAGSSLASFFSGGYLRVRLIARTPAPVQTGVPLATTGLDGLVGSRAKGHQQFGGLKGFVDGAYSIGNVRDPEGAGTTTLNWEDKRHQEFNLSAARTVVLPSTSILKGDVWVLENRGAFDLTVQSSALNTILLLKLSKVVLVALQDAPTSSAHWQLVSRVSFVESNIRASEGAGTTTLTDGDVRKQVFNLSAARTVVLPTTAIKAGDRWRIENRGAFDLTVQASGGLPLTIANSANFDATIQVGHVVLTALQDSPTTPAHWLVEDVYEKLTHTTTFTFNGTGGTSGANNLTVVRDKDKVLVQVVGAILATTGTGSTSFNSDTDLAVRFRPISVRYVMAAVRQSGAGQTTPGLFGVAADGNLHLLRDTPGTAFTNAAANTGFDASVALTYVR